MRVIKVHPGRVSLLILGASVFSSIALGGNAPTQYGPQDWNLWRTICTNRQNSNMENCTLYAGGGRLDTPVAVEGATSDRMQAG